jgi:hypothetical protein
MHLPFNILKKAADGSFRLFEGMADLRSAWTRIDGLLVGHPGDDYVVFAQRTHELIYSGGLDCRATRDSKRE